MEIGKHIQYYRKRDGLTQEDLAEKLLVSRNSVSNWERGKNYPDIEMLWKMSILFNVTIDYLVKGDLEKMKKELEVGYFNQWSMVMIIAFSLLALFILPSFHYFNSYGFLVLVPLGLVGIYAGYRTEVYKRKIKQNNNLKTYEQILNYIESDGQNQDTEYHYHRPKNIVTLSIYCIIYFVLLFVLIMLFL
ncbi:helix-turn-helix domain-containing protein [Oceanobacillus locisalsi]|uniref:Helix-turn-helix domain-containing protein n=1 Tax=Oceanobacillus locisalsi TaxID=546107 RepID=A0ABW3NJY1_9BACI